MKTKTATNRKPKAKRKNKATTERREAASWRHAVAFESYLAAWSN